MQLKHKAIIAAVASGEATPDENGLVHYAVSFAKKGAKHQHQVKDADVEAYKRKEIERELAEIDQALQAGDENLKDPDGLRKRKAELEAQ